MTATTVIADSPAEVSTRRMPSWTMSWENTVAKENNANHRVVMVSAFLRPQRSAMTPPMMDPKNMPTNDSEVT